MRLQSTVFSNTICKKEELYFRKKGTVSIYKNGLFVKKESSVSTKAYWNLFDADAWYQYTGYVNYIFSIQIKGMGILKLYSYNHSGNQLVKEVQFETQNDKSQKLSIEFRRETEKELFYFEILANSDVYIIEAYYEILSKENTNASDINLSIIICTYHRQEQLFCNLQKLKESQFFDSKSILYGHMDIHIVDNASELELENEEFVHLYYNSNSGGSGGFSRGIYEVQKRIENYSTTNVVFMDDDAEFVMETFYRLYAILTHLKREKQNTVIAGRMFRMDKQEVQYTALEVWNKGNIIHTGENLDMTDTKNLLQMNYLKGEYTGWWLGCFPIEFVKDNMPLPFFLHCDDVEYGLRHGGRPIILNGIQVWHETYEYRQSPIIRYYDTRNPLFVNEKYRLNQDWQIIYQEWKKSISNAHIEKEWLAEYMVIRGLLDYMRGWDWLLHIDGEQYHKKLMKKNGVRWKNAILWRYAAIKIWKLSKSKRRTNRR